MLRTFSKAYGLAGVRVGYAREPPVGRRHAQSSAPGIQRVGRWVSPARRRRSTTRDHVTAAVKVAVAERARVAARLEKSGTPRVALGRQFPDVACRSRMPGRASMLCYARGIIVRPVGNYGLPEHLRVTLGTVEQNDRFLRAWEA